MVSKREIIENLYWRIQTEYPVFDVSLGCGTYQEPGIVLIQSAQTKGRQTSSDLLKVVRHMGLEPYVFLATLNIVKGAPLDKNLYYLRELLDILSPLVVVSIDDVVLRALRSLSDTTRLSRYRGRTFMCDVLRRKVLGVYNPSVYSSPKGDKRIKKISKTHWETIYDAFVSAKIAHVADRWGCSQNEAEKLVKEELA